MARGFGHDSTSCVEHGRRPSALRSIKEKQWPKRWRSCTDSWDQTSCKITSCAGGFSERSACEDVADPGNSVSAPGELKEESPALSLALPSSPIPDRSKMPAPQSVGPRVDVARPMAHPPAKTSREK